MSPLQKSSSTGPAANPSGGLGGQPRIGGAVTRRIAALQNWASEHRAAAVALAALSVTTVTAGILAVLLMRTSGGEVTPVSALAALDRKDLARAVFEAEQLVLSSRKPGPHRSTAAFILGAVELDRAQTSDSSLATRYALSAASYLEQSRRWGFPSGRHGEGYAMLGRSQFLIGNYPEALEAFEEALARGVEPVEELHRLAAQSCLRLPTPLPRVALDHLRASIASEKIAPADRSRAIIQQAQVQFALEDYEACRHSLQSLPAKDQAAGEAALLFGRLLLVEADRLALGGDPSADAEQVSETAPVDAPPADEISPTKAAQQRYEQAVETFRTALLHRTTDPRLVAELHYGLAQAYHRLGDHALALRQLRRIQSGFSVQDVAFKAALDEGELLFARGDYSGLVNAHRQVMERIPGITPGTPSPVTDELRRRCLANVERLKSERAFAEAIELVRAAKALLPPVENCALTAQTYEAWGENLMAAAIEVQDRARTSRGNETVPAGQPGALPSAADKNVSGDVNPSAQAPPQSKPLNPLSLMAVEVGQADGLFTPGFTPEAQALIDEARACYRKAGQAYSELAHLRRPTAHYPDDLWLAAEAFHRARDYPAAIRMLKAYLEHARPNTRQPEALVRLGEMWLAEGNGEQAVAALKDVLDLHSRHPAKYAARLLLAQAYLELGQADKAAAELQANLEGDDLTPASPEWRAALFALGQLRYGQQQWDDAARLLEQAVARYPEDPQAASASYLLGECYLQQSRAQADAKVPPLAVAERNRADAVQSLTEKALAALDRARVAFERLAAANELTLLQESMLRNTYFTRAAVLKQLGRLDEALDAYTALINRYQHSPAVLDAYIQAAAIYREQRQEAKARNTIAAAQSALKRMPDNGLVQDLTGESKADWERYLAWLANP